MFHQSHSAVFRPAFLVVITDYILVVRVWVFSQKPLNKLSGIIRCKLENDVQVINISHVHSNRMPSLNLYRLKKHELILILRWTCKFIRTVQTKNQQINNHPVELEDE